LARLISTHWHAAARDGRSVADRDEDHVALVTLHVFEVLDEERLGVMHLEKRLDLRRKAAAQDFELVHDRAALGCGEGRDAEREFGVIARVRDDRLRHDPRLHHVSPRGTSVEHALRDAVEAQAHARFRRVGTGHDEQLVLVELAVADRDQRLVLAAVMPAQHPHRQAARGE
jgi:hypothetical protein